MEFNSFFYPTFPRVTFLDFKKVVAPDYNSPYMELVVINDDLVFSGQKESKMQSHRKN